MTIPPDIARTHHRAMMCVVEYLKEIHRHYGYIPTPQDQTRYEHNAAALIARLASLDPPIFLESECIP